MNNPTAKKLLNIRDALITLGMTTEKMKQRALEELDRGNREVVFGMLDIYDLIINAGQDEKGVKK